MTDPRPIDQVVREYVATADLTDPKVQRIVELIDELDELRKDQRRRLASSADTTVAQ